MKAFALVLALLATVTATPTDAPRSGTYRILSYGATNRPPLVLGTFELGAGTYKAFLNGGRQTGEGRYHFDAATTTVIWDSGPYQGVWGGAFSIDDGGRTHKIRMKSTTIGVNTLK